MTKHIFFNLQNSPHFPLRGKVCQLSERKRRLCWSTVYTVSPPAESLSSSLARILFLSLSRKGTYCMLSSLKIIWRAGKSRDTIPKDVSWSWNSFFVNLFISSLLRQRQTHTVCTQYNVSRPAMSAVAKIIRRQHDFESEQFFVKKTVVPNLQSRFVQWLLC